MASGIFTMSTTRAGPPFRRSWPTELADRGGTTGAPRRLLAATPFVAPPEARTTGPGNPAGARKIMTEDRIEGVAQQGVGRVEDAWGGLAGDARTQADGKLRQATGKVQDLYGQAKETVRKRFGERGQQAVQRVDDTVELIGRNPVAAVAVAAVTGLTLGLLANAGRQTRVVYVKR
jgi:uncharacterized protein YjbJ (UPF0337 family)